MDSADAVLTSSTVRNGLKLLRRLKGSDTVQNPEEDEALTSLLGWLERLSRTSSNTEVGGEECIYLSSYRRKFSRVSQKIPLDRLSLDKQREQAGSIPETQEEEEGSAEGKGGAEVADDSSLLGKQLQLLDCWDEFDIFEVATLSGGHPLVAVGTALFRRFGLVDRLGIPLAKLRAYLQDVERSYASNPYHNATHAADVAQTLGAMMAMDGLAARLGDVEVLAVLFSALIHDVGHPGVSNDYLINSRAPAALTYNDVSVNENGHLAIAFGLLRQTGKNFLEQLSPLQWRYFRSTVVKIVLATDMAGHKDLMREFGATSKSYSGDVSTWPDDKRVLLLQVLVHVADIGNPTKPLRLSKQWTTRVMDEFFGQGDRERQQGMPISPLCDRTVVETSKSQQAFLQYVVRPSFDALAAVAPRTAETAMRNIRAATEHWVEQQQQQDKTASRCA